jgi:hypothetical protein
MEPEHIRFGGGVVDTLLHPLVAVAMAVAIILICCLRRRYAIVPLLLGLFFIPKGQVIVLLGLHFTMARILILAGLARWARLGRSKLAGQFNSIDRLFVLLNFSLLIVFSLQWMDARAFVKNFSDFIDAAGGYFLLRFLIRDQDDVRRAVKTLAIVAIIMAGFMINEQVTGRNLFGLLGGIPPEGLRDGHIRSQGAFEVFITAGAFGATLLPLLVWLWSDAKSRIVASLGLIGATVMTVTCYASTNIATYAAGILALCSWGLRRRMRLVRWGLVAALVGLHLVMNGPVWSLIEKIDLTGSSSNYHRYMLVDNFIRHFGDWWLLGFKNYHTWGWDMWDLSNQYVACGLTGGLLSLTLFIALIVLCFAKLGTARKRVARDHREGWFLWCLGAAVFSHVVAYFGIGYFDQMQFAWYALLAVISVATATRAQSRATQSVPELAGLSSDPFPSTA